MSKQEKEIDTHTVSAGGRKSTYMYACVYVHTHMHTCMCKHMQMHSDTHTHTHHIEGVGPHFGSGLGLEDKPKPGLSFETCLSHFLIGVTQQDLLGPASNPPLLSKNFVPGLVSHSIPSVTFPLPPTIHLPMFQNYIGKRLIA